MTKQTLLPPHWPRPKGYANGISCQGQLIFVAGMIGWNEQGEFPSDNLAEQVAQALRNIVAVLQEGGAKPQHIVRMTWYVIDKKDYINSYAEIGRYFRQIIGDFQIAMTAVEVKALIEDQAKVEIEVTAVIPT